MQVPDGGYPETGGLFNRNSFHGQFTAPCTRARLRIRGSRLACRE